MMGKDVERLLAIMDGLKPLIVDAINTLAADIENLEEEYEDPKKVDPLPPVTIPTISGGIDVDHSGEINSAFGVVGGDLGNIRTWTKTELEKLIDWDKKFVKQLYKTKTDNVFGPIKDYMEETQDERKKFQTIEKKMFSSANSFFNSIGSPFNEYELYLTAYRNARSYANAHSKLEYVGEKVAMMSLLTPLLPLIVDFKMVLIQYNDYIQRGYDLLFNDNVPSITIQRTKNKKTNGNISQKTNNVDVPEESIDPY